MCCTNTYFVPSLLFVSELQFRSYLLNTWSIKRICNNMTGQNMCMNKKGYKTLAKTEQRTWRQFYFCLRVSNCKITFSLQRFVSRCKIAQLTNNKQTLKWSRTSFQINIVRASRTIPIFLKPYLWQVSLYLLWTENIFPSSVFISPLLL